MITQELTDLDRISEGYIILVTGLVIVFGALLLLSLFFKYAMPAMLGAYKMVTTGRGKKSTERIKPDKDQPELTGEVVAAISMALHLYLHEQRHDTENTVLTIKQARKLYAPWSSKIYGVQNRIGVK